MKPVSKHSEHKDPLVKWALYLILAGVTFGDAFFLKEEAPDSKMEKFVLDSYFKKEDHVQASAIDLHPETAVKRDYLLNFLLSVYGNEQ